MSPTTLARLLATALLTITPFAHAGVAAAAAHAHNPSSRTTRRDDDAQVRRLTRTPLLPTYNWYIVRPGDTVESVAQRSHDMVWPLRRRNGGLWDMAPGRHIRILRWPFDTPYWETRSSTTDSPQQYTVRAGDSLWAIAQRLHTDVATLATQNSLGDGLLIYAGQQLLLHHYSVHAVRVRIPTIPVTRVHTGLLLTDLANLIGTDAALIKATFWYESGWQMIPGSSGEIGMVQIMPETAAWVQQNLVGYPLDPHPTLNNALLGTLLLAYYLDINHHDAHKALALYHSGNTAADARNGSYIRTVLRLRAYYYHHPRAGF